MIFETKASAREYAKDQTQLTRRTHKAAPCQAWIHDRRTGSYELMPRYTVILAG